MGQSPSRTRVRVLILDDHEWPRAQLASRLASSPNLDVVGEGGVSEEELPRALTLQPDVVLMECKGQSCDCPRLIQSLRQALPDARVAILTSYVDGAEKERARTAGAHAYLLKEIDTPGLVAAIARLASRSIP